MENQDSYILSSYYRELNKLQQQQQQQQQQQKQMIQMQQPPSNIQQMQHQQQQQMMMNQQQNQPSFNQYMNTTRTNGPSMNNDDDSSKAENVCHGCGHSGHNRPSCPFKDVPGWVAKGKRTQPLDVYGHNGHPPVSTVGMCHGCGHFGHSRIVCPYRDYPGWFHYGQRRVPLDVTAKTISNPSNGDVCHGCGNPGHNRPQCPYKDLPGFIHRGQRRIPLDVNQTSVMNPNGSTTSSETTGNEGSDSPMTLNRELLDSSHNNQNQPLQPAVPLIPAVCQSTINPSETFHINVMFDASKTPNMISKKLFDQICLSGDASISRRDINIQLYDRTLPLSYCTRLQLAFIDVNFEIEEEFYITDSIFDVIIGYNLIFTHNLYQLFDHRFNLQNNNNIQMINNNTNNNSNVGINSGNVNYSPSILPGNDGSPLLQSSQLMSGPSSVYKTIQSSSLGNVDSYNNNNGNLFIPTSVITTSTVNSTSLSFHHNPLDNSTNDINDNSLWYNTSNTSNLPNQFNGFDVMSSDNILNFSHMSINNNRN